MSKKSEEILKINPNNVTMIWETVLDFPYYFEGEDDDRGALSILMFDAVSRWAIGRADGTIEAKFSTWVYPEWQHMPARIREEERGDTPYAARSRNEVDAFGEEVNDDYISAQEMQGERSAGYEFKEQHFNIDGCDLTLPIGMMLRCGRVSTGGATAAQAHQGELLAKKTERRLHNGFWVDKPFKD